MKNLLVAVTLLVFPTLSNADESSHRKAAEQLLGITNASESMRAGFDAALEPMLNQMKLRGAPEAALTETRAALQDWLRTEVKFEDIQPKILDIYVQEFTEAELRDLIAFYETPTGKKTIQTLPVVLQKSIQVGQEYAHSKSETLNARIKAIVEKHKPAAAPK
jgi:hypothetical protein